MTYVFEGMRQVLRGGPPPFFALAMSFALNILYLMLAIVFFNTMFEKEARPRPGTRRIDESA